MKMMENSIVINNNINSKGRRRGIFSTSLKLNHNKNTIFNIIETKAYSASDADLKNIHLDIMPLLNSINNNRKTKNVTKSVNNNEDDSNKSINNKPITRHRNLIKIKQKKKIIESNDSNEKKEENKNLLLGRSHSARASSSSSSSSSTTTSCGVKSIVIRRPKSNECKSSTTKIECSDGGGNKKKSSLDPLLDSKLNDKKQLVDSSSKEMYQQQINNNLTKYQYHKKSGQRFNLLHEGDVCVCKLPHSRNLISKILNLRLLRRWKQHKILLGETEISSTTVSFELF